MVSNLADDGSSGCLRSQIKAAETAGSGNTVTFQQGLSGTIVLLQGQLSLSTSVNIDATNANIAIDGNASRVFFIAGNPQANPPQEITVKLTNLTIEGGLATGDSALGGGIFINTANVTLDQCTVWRNQALGGNAAGGGLFVFASQLQANQCNITDNTAEGAVQPQGGGIYADDSSVDLTGGTLLRNKAVAGTAPTQGPGGALGGEADGGALYADTGPITLQGVEIDNNVAQGGSGGSNPGANGLPGGDALGGALALFFCSSADIIDCPSHDNSANGGAGGAGGDGFVAGTGGRGGDAQGGWLYDAGTPVSMDSGSPEFITYVIQGNGAVGGSGGAGGKGGFQGGQGGDGGNGQGGAIYASQAGEVDLPEKAGAPLEFYQPWGLYDNRARGGAGGAGGVGGAGGNGGNGGDAQGGGVDLIQTSGTITGFVAYNSAQGGQGGFAGTGLNVAGNGGNGGNGTGGALHIEGAFQKAAISTGPYYIFVNSAYGGPGGNGGNGPNGGMGGNGGSANGGALDASQNSDLQIGDDFLESNLTLSGTGGNGGGPTTDTGQGGMGGAGGPAQGAAVNLNSAIGYVVHSNLLSNRSVGGAGGFAGPAWSVDPADSSGSGGNGGAGGSSQGGALAVEGASASPTTMNTTILTNDIFNDNHAVGGVGSDGASGLGNSNVYDGGNGGNGGIGAIGQGGGVLITGDSNVSIENTTLSNNSAEGGRGGSGGSTFELHFVQFGDAGGAAEGGNGDGGGLFADGGIVTLVNNTLSGNLAKGGQGGQGGADGNRASDGGDGGEGRGGGLAAEGADFLVVNNTFNADRAQGGNGGYGGTGNIYIPAGTGGDGLDGEGGAIYVNAGTLDLVNVTIDGNIAASGDAGLGGLPNKVNGVQLPSYGGGIYVDFGVSVPDVELTNTIVAQDQADHDPDIAGFVQSGDHDLIGNGTGANFVTSNMDQIGGTNGNPVINPQLNSIGNYGGPTQTMIPMSGSPVVDRGDDAAVPIIAAAESVQQATDQRGLSRVVGLHIDVGATEYGVGPTAPLPGSPPNGAPGGRPPENAAVLPGFPYGPLPLPGEAFEAFGFAPFFAADFLEDIFLHENGVSQESSLFPAWKG